MIKKNNLKSYLLELYYFPSADSDFRTIYNEKDVCINFGTTQNINLKIVASVQLICTGAFFCDFFFFFCHVMGRRG